MTEKIQGEIKHYLSKKNPYFSKFSSELKNHLNALYPSLPIRTQWYMLKNNITTLPMCSYNGCSNQVKWNERKKQFDRGCCKAHNQKITFIEKYGTEHPNQNKQHFKETQTKLQEKTGYKFGEDPSIIKKRRETNLEKYGVEEIGSSKQVREKIKQTNLERYGVEETMSVPEIRTKAKETMLKKYGVEHSLSNPEIRAKANKTNLEKYGTIFPMKNEELLNKRRNHIIEKYDAYSPNPKKEDDEKYYHLDKSIEFENNNKTYYYFFDWELKNKIKQIDWIKHQKIEQVISKISITRITSSVRDRFISDNSLYSNDSEIRQNYGLLDDNQLVGIISGYEKSDFYEITRFVTKIGVSFETNPIQEFIQHININKTTVISFDRRYTSIKQPELESIGFEFVGGTEPKNHKSHNSQNIWDCGKLVYKRKKT